MLTEQVMIRVDSDTLDQLKQNAEKNGRTVAQTVRYFVKKGLEEEDGGRLRLDHETRLDMTEYIKKEFDKGVRAINSLGVTVLQNPDMSNAEAAFDDVLGMYTIQTDDGTIIIQSQNPYVDG